LSVFEKPSLLTATAAVFRHTLMDNFGKYSLFFAPLSCSGVANGPITKAGGFSMVRRWAGAAPLRETAWRGAVVLR
jgi:hypothetical protein